MMAVVVCVLASKAGAMTEDERSETDLGSLSEKLASARHSIGDEAVQETAAADKDRPRLVSLPERERDAARLAATLIEAFAQYLLNAERRVLNQVDKARALVLGDFERQRSSVESLIGLFAERLREQEDSISALQRDLTEANQRLDRQADALRSLRHAEAQQMALVKQILELLKHLGASA